MNRQITAGVGSCGFRVANLVSGFRHLNVLSIAVASALFFGLQLSAQAGGNLANLYDWNNTTPSVPPSSLGQYINIYSGTSASFLGGYNNQGGGVSPTLLGTFDTTPGATYQVSFTMQNLNSFSGSAYETFGDSSMNFDLPYVYINGGESYADTPVNIDFTAVATSDITTMSIQCYLDPYGGAAGLSDLVVAQVPEVSSISLFCFGGCALLLASRWQSFLPKLKMKRIRR